MNCSALALPVGLVGGLVRAAAWWRLRAVRA
jgi:hypothetical protein